VGAKAVHGVHFAFGIAEDADSLTGQIPRQNLVESQLRGGTENIPALGDNLPIVEDFVPGLGLGMDILMFGAPFWSPLMGCLVHIWLMVFSWLHYSLLAAATCVIFWRAHQKSAKMIQTGLRGIVKMLMDKKTMGTAEVIGGMGLLLLGHKLKGLGMFAHGFTALEELYREAHPELKPGLQARWEKATEFYEANHQNETNRTLHRLGIPFIVGGALGLLVSKPHRLPWMVSAAAFAGGWASNIIGHSVYEKNAPAFTEDPLSFIAGPVWDIQQMMALSNAQQKGRIEERVTVEVENA